jgi:hypothetical protein
MVWLNIIRNKFPLNYVKSVSFLGGEPFESVIPLEFLKLLKSTHGSLQATIVHFQTNGSVKPSDELIELLSECKLFRFNISIDGVGRRLEYLRYPIIWDRLQTNIDYVKSIGLPNIKFKCLATINALNVWYYDELELWAQHTFDQDDLNFLKPNTSQGNIALAQTPMLLRQKVFNKFGADHSVSKLLSNLPVEPLDICIDYLDRLDQHRKIFWREIFPDVVPYLEKTT